MSAADRDVAEALAALDRLQRHGVLPLEDAREAARLLSGDPAYEFPDPAAPRPVDDGRPAETPS